jgi:hypothetical protein
VQHRLGSISKTVTAVAVLRLRDEGRLDLDDPLERHVPGRRSVTARSASCWRTPPVCGPRRPASGGSGSPGCRGTGCPSQLTGDDVKSRRGSALPLLQPRLRGARRAGRQQAPEAVVRRRARRGAAAARHAPHVPRPSGRAPAASPSTRGPTRCFPEPEEDAGAMAPAGQLWASLADLGRFAAFLLGDTGDVLDAGHARGDGRAVRRRQQREGLVGVRPGSAGRPARRPDADRPRGLDAGLPGQRVRGPRGGSRDRGAVQRHQRPGTARWSPTCRRSSAEAEPALGAVWAPADELDPSAMELVGPWYLGHLRLRPAAAGRRPARPHRPDRRRPGVAVPGGRRRELGRAGRLPRGRAAAGAADGDRAVALDVGSFVFSRTPYDPAAPQPGGVHPDGWGPHQAAGE